MIYFSSKLYEKFPSEARGLFDALEAKGEKYSLVEGTKDIRMRDFMPIRTADGSFVSFRYEPSYLKKYPRLRTDFGRDLAERFDLPFACSDINLDGGNAVFSPSRKKVLISERVLAENPDRGRNELTRELGRILGADVILIPSLKSDFTGHADGMVRFLDENTVIGNRVVSKNGLEQRIKRQLQRCGIGVIDFTCRVSGLSAAGCYLNYLETENCVFLPVFGLETDDGAVAQAEALFDKAIVPVKIPGIAEEGGALNCISWEDGRE